LARPSIFDLFTGIGKAEHLRHGLSGYWSRGITGASIA
jgi:Txe/YoeB family toxin of Txe-Axe toxin-antitoxin module